MSENQVKESQSCVASHCPPRQGMGHYIFFYRSDVQTLPSYGSDVQTSSTSHLLASQFRHSDFVFCRLGVQTSPSYGLDV